MLSIFFWMPSLLKRKISRWAVFTLLALGITACRSVSTPMPTNDAATPIPALQTTKVTTPVTEMPEIPVQLIPLSGPIEQPQAELSGLAWDQNTLLLLPQYPERFTLSTAADSDGAIFAISKDDILAFLDGKSNTPLNPRLIPIYAPGLRQLLAGYEGYESILVAGERIYFTIETHQIGGMVGILLAGEFNDDHSEILIDTGKLDAISAQASIANFSEEALTLVNQQLLTLYEANGAKITPTPVGHLFDLSLDPQGVIISPNLEYRITDATPADEQGRFWVMNYFFPGDTKITPLMDPLKEKYGTPPAQHQAKIVERLVQFQWKEHQINLADRPPIYLRLLPDATARNWEGLALLDERGFLLVTDQYPTTLFSFVRFP